MEQDIPSRGSSYHRVLKFIKTTLQCSFQIIFQQESIILLIEGLEAPAAQEYIVQGETYSASAGRVCKTFLDKMHADGEYKRQILSNAIHIISLM